MEKQFRFTVKCNCLQHHYPNECVDNKQKIAVNTSSSFASALYCEFGNV